MKIKNLKSRLAPSSNTSGTRRIALRLPRGWPETDPSVHWYAPGRAGGEHAGRAESLAELPDFVRASPVHVWTPPAETLLTRASIPTRSRARILQALPFALEEQLLDEPDQLHFAYVHELDGTLAVAVTRRARLTLWADIFRGANIRAASLAPAVLALPLSSDAWSATFAEDEIWVRTGPFTGFVALADFAAPPPLLVTALREATEQNRAPKRLIIYRTPGAVDLGTWSDALGIPVITESSDFWDSAIVPSLNLLQAEFSASGGQLRQLARPLMPAAIMLAIWLIGTLTVDTIEWWRLRNSYNATMAEMNTLFLRHFPETKIVRDPAAQMQKGLEALQTRGGGPADMLPLLARVTPMLKSQQKIKLNGLRYGERSLTLDIALPDYQTLDAMKNNLQSANLDVEVQAANNRGGEIESRLRIQPAAAKSKPRQS